MLIGYIGSNFSTIAFCQKVSVMYRKGLRVWVTVGVTDMVEVGLGLWLALHSRNNCITIRFQNISVKLQFYC
jgi:hypothetical protein